MAKYFPNILSNYVPFLLVSFPKLELGYELTLEHCGSKPLYLHYSFYLLELWITVTLYLSEGKMEKLSEKGKKRLTTKAL